MLPSLQKTDWLAGLFLRSGLLKDSSLSVLSVEELTGNHSSWVGRLKVRYHDPDSHNLPESIILKLSSAPEERAELLFHTLMENDEVIAPVMASGYDTSTERCYLLMPDLCETHKLLSTAEQTFTQPALSGDSIRQAIIHLAHFHQLTAGKTEQASELGYARYRSRPAALMESPAYCSRLAQDFSVDIAFGADIRTLLTRAIHYHNRVLRPRFSTGNNLAIIHGDCFWHHFWQSKTHPGSLLLFDFDLATVHSPIQDLVMLMCSPMPHGWSWQKTLDVYSRHAATCQTLEEITEEFLELSVSHIFYWLAERDRGCPEMIWRTCLNQLLTNLKSANW